MKLIFKSMDGRIMCKIYFLSYIMLYLLKFLQLIHSTLITKVHLVKAMVFPVVMYECESWTIKKA